MRIISTLVELKRRYENKKWRTNRYATASGGYYPSDNRSGIKIRIRIERPERKVFESGKTN